MDFNDILRMMVQDKASDLFVTADMPPSIKVHGRIRPVSRTRLNEQQSRELVLTIMTPEQREEFLRTKEGNFAFNARGIGRFRVSAFVNRDAFGMVVRRIETEIPTIQELGLPEIMIDLASAKRGILLFVGATGTGKSTSLAAIIEHRNRHGGGHIITVEDPIEFVHFHSGCIVTQREVGVDTESYEVALRNTLRQAPDVIMIGEIRTRQVMEHAITFAETGHLVLTTLHANNANQALDRMLHFFPEDRRDQVLMDLSLNLRGIIAQQLITRPDGNGRRAAVEVLLNTPLMADLIHKNKLHKIKELMARSNEQGMNTFDQALYDLYKRGEISQEEALAHADSANEVRLMIKLGDNRPGMRARDIEAATIVQ